MSTAKTALEWKIGQLNDKLEESLKANEDLNANYEWSISQLSIEREGSLKIHQTLQASLNTTNINLEWANFQLQESLKANQGLQASLDATTRVVHDYERKDIFKQGAQLKSRCWDLSSEPDIIWNKVVDKCFSKVELPQDHPLVSRVERLFYETVAGTLKPTKIVFVQNFLIQNKFEATLLIMSEQGHHQDSSPFNTRYSPSPEKEAVLKRFSIRYDRVSENHKIKVVLTWVGISTTNVEMVCNTGLIDLRKTDKGYFGAGIYSTLQASYAMKYAEGTYPGATALPPNADGEHCLLLCWVAVGNVYPISRDKDYHSYSPFSHFHHQDNGLALKPGFDSHCACVWLDESSFYQAAKYHLEKKDFDYSSKELVDEIVVKESAQILPYCIVYYKSQK